MRIILLIVAVAIFLTSCDNRQDPFFLKDVNPVVLLKRQSDTTYKHTINDSNKIGVVYQLQVKYIIDEQVPLKQYKSFRSDSINLLNKTLYIHNNNVGTGNYSLKLTDSYGKSDSAVLNLVSFKNLPPVCVINVTKSTDLSTKEVVINASSSYDLDKKWGGYILNYKYNINGLVFVNSIDSCRYVFGSSGQKKISVQVMDNDSAWSETITKFVTF